MDKRSNTKHFRSASDIDTNDAPPPKRTSLVLLEEVLSATEMEVIATDVRRGYRFFLPSIDKLINDRSDVDGLDALARVLGDMVASAARFPHSEVQKAYTHWVECSKLMESNMEVFDATMAAVEAIRQDKPVTDEAIRNIFRLQALRLPRTTSDEGAGQGALQTELANAAKKSWISPYVGDCPATLLADINSHVMAAYAQGHGSIGAMIQSSGTGKSRTMHEIARLVFTIPINIRSTSSDDIGAPYPEPDTSVREYLIPSGKVQLRKRYHCFLRATFELVEEEFNGFCLENEDRSARALHWREHLSSGNVRETLYHRIVERAIIYEGDVADLNLVHATNESFNKLRDAVVSKDALPQGDLKILIYFDEVHTLAAETPGPTNYDTLCSALADIGDLNHFCHVHVDDGCTKEPWPPPARISFISSSGSKNDITCTVHNPPVRHRTSGAAQTGNFRNTTKHQTSCCFWWHTMLAAGASPAALVALAKSKLTHKNESLSTSFNAPGAVITPSKSVEELKEIVETTVVGIRVMIEFSPRREKAHRLQEEMVAGHMRIAFSIPSHRECMRSGHPSEPILAEMAACTIYEENVDMVKVISDLLQSDLLDKDERGELVARLLLTLAWNKAIHTLMSVDQFPSHGVSHAGGRAVYSRPIPLIQFLTALLPSGYLELVLQSTPDNRFGGNTFREAFEHAYVHFTHFGRAGSSDAINSASSLAAFIRGMAFQSCYGHPVIDILIPVLIIPKDVATQPNFDVGELTLDKFHRSCMIISVKDKENAERKNYTISAESLNFWVDQDMDVDVPYIAIVMQLSSHRVPESTRTLSMIGANDGPTRATNQSSSSRKAHPRYSIIISGCSSTVSTVISPDEQVMYSAMLGPKGMLHEHHYNNEGTLLLLRRMKPFWNLGSSCFDWVDVPGVDVVPDIVEMEYVPGVSYSDRAVIIQGDDGTWDVEENNAADIWHDS
ncbi:hypothetical protein IW261DRAFT_1562550 [Armillaria novae-zelandiae]|uniref:Uncharacterized protein n=1 Tax=Armillaria novae-zelandiae TaxID=153914 RepID=A0AA39U9M4_9AGAR|nr:hypothetical protein IW261DRAFT_1562550 [Armillaria novae-zelandiae]